MQLRLLLGDSASVVAWGDVAVCFGSVRGDVTATFGSRRVQLAFRRPSPAS